MIRSVVVAFAATLLAAGTAHAQSPEARVQDLVTRLNYTNVGRDTSAHHLFLNLGIPSNFNPRAKMQNPVPDFLPGWDSLNPSNSPSQVDIVQAAIAQAVVNKTWTAKVTADYTKFRKGWAAIEKDYAPKVAELEKLGYYERAAGLAKLYQEVWTRAENEKILYARGHATQLYDQGKSPASVGYLGEIVAQMIAAHRASHVEFMLPGYLVAAKIDLADYAKARPWATDDTIERDTFLAFSQEKGNLETPKLPMWDSEGNAFKAVRWPTSDERDKATAAARAELLKASAARFEVGEVPKTHSLLDGETPDKANLYWLEGGNSKLLDPLVVTAVKPAKDGGVDVAIKSEKRVEIPYDCRRQRPQDDVMCFKVKTEKTALSFDVHFATLPAELTLTKGDEIIFYADFLSVADKKTSKAYKLEGRAIRKVKRAGNQVVAYW
jgi:hypothetical protein